MNHYFAAAMRRAARLTRAGDVVAATRAIQSALRREISSPQTEGTRTATPPQRFQQPAMLRLVGPNEEASTRPEADPRKTLGKSSVQPSPRIRRPLGETLSNIREARRGIGMGMSVVGKLRASQPPPIPEGARFLTRSFSSLEGRRTYKLYLPASARDRPRGLVVMLHGCKQDPDDFAAGTNMNAAAEAQGLAVAYPFQTGSDNAMSCWNWFNPADQMRDAGEPAIIAGITREIASQYRLDRQVIFVAGLSAGGAMAAVMGETYPDLYAAVGVHSGLAYKSANDVVSAFAAMRGEAGLSSRAKLRIVTGAEPHVRTIVFHGSADQTVSPANAHRIVEAVGRHHAGAVPSVEQGLSAGGRNYSRTVIASENGNPAVEYWLIDGAGHAWSGGSPAGSYTDPQGPDASVEMIRFFLGP